MAQSGRATRAENVCFEWKNGHDANGPLCPLTTQSGPPLLCRCQLRHAALPPPPPLAVCCGSTFRRGRIGTTLSDSFQ